MLAKVPWQTWSVFCPRARDETGKLDVSMGKGLTYVGTFYLRLQIRFIVAARTVQVQNCILQKKHNSTALYLFSTDKISYPSKSNFIFRYPGTYLPGYGRTGNPMGNPTGWACTAVSAFDTC